MIPPLCFSIDALSAAGNEAWRLSDDMHHWRTCAFAEDLKGSDVRIYDQDEASGWSGMRLVRDKQLCLKPRAKPGIFNLLMTGIFAHSIVHRLSPPAMPDKDQFVDTVKETEPGRPWLIYLDLSGYFRVLDTSKVSILGNIRIAVRGEITSSPGYIGPKAASDEKLMEEMFLQFLEGWYIHLQSRRAGVFVPDKEKLANKQILRQKILDWHHE